MTCKHRWEPSNFAIKYRTPNLYIYECARCGKSIFATLKEKQNGN
jgi:DNA-directed RNA polymerase subunit RPC12/RpoP